MEPDNVNNSFLKAAIMDGDWSCDEAREYVYNSTYGLGYKSKSKSIPKPKMHFKSGDIVVLKTGNSPQEVIAINPSTNEIKCRYLTSRKELGFRSANDYELYTRPFEKPITEEKEENMASKLYKVISADGKERFGEFKAMDGDRIILAMSDAGYEGFLSSEIKRVMPYTYDVMFNGTGRVYSYKGVEGEVAVGDILMDEGMTLSKVVAINTESDSATKFFTGVKVNTTVLSAGKS